MAKKRLNKKLIGILSLVTMAILVVAVIIVIQYKFRDPRPFMETAYQQISEARAAQARHEAEVADIEDPKERYDRLVQLKGAGSDELWREAMENLGQAMRYARGNWRLRREAQNELAKLYGEIRVFLPQRDVWKRMFEQDASNYEAKKNLVEYEYLMAQTGASASWPELYAEAQVLIELNEQQDLKDPYGYVVRAHSCLGMISAKLEQDPMERKAEGVELLGRALEQDENSLEAYRMLGRFKDLEADEAGKVEEREKFRQEAQEYFFEAIERNPDDVTAYVHYLEDHLYRRAMFKYVRGQRLEDEQGREQALAEAREFVEEEVLSVLDKARRKFPEDAQLAAYGGRIALTSAPGREGLDAAIESYEEAVQLDPEDDRLYVRLADYYRRRARLAGEDREDLEAAFRNLWRCLYLPDTADPQGPEIRRHMQRRLLVLRSLVDVSSKLAADAEPQEKERYLDIATQSAKDLRDRLGEEHIWSKVAQGTALLARGERDDGIRFLYEADKERDATGRPDGYLKLMLFEALRGTEYRTLAMDYAEDGLRLVSYSPTIIPRYMRTMLALPGTEIAPRVLSLVDGFERALENSASGITQDDRDELALIRAQAYLRQGKHAEMREVLKAVQQDDIDVRILRARSHDTPAQRMAVLEELVKEDYGHLFIIRPLLRYYLSLGGEDPTYYDKGRQLAARALEVRPDDFFLQEMLLILAEPDPGQVDGKRVKEIRLAVRKKIADPHERQIALAAEYKGLATTSLGAGDPEAAAEYWKLCKDSYAAAAEIDTKDLKSLSGLFDVAVMQKDWQLAAELVPRISSLDPDLGILSEGHLKAAQSQWDDAADRLEKYLAVRPISVLGHLGLGQVYSARGQLEKAIAEVKTAVDQDATHVEGNRLLLQLLHQRNNDVGLDKLTSAQLLETIIPLDVSLSRNPGDIQVRRLQVVYYPLWVALQRQRTETDSTLDEVQRQSATEQMDRVMAQVINSCRGLISVDPNNPQNWLVYAAVVYDESDQTEDPEKKKALLDSAEEIYRTGLEHNPKSSQLALQYDMFLERIGAGEAGEHLEQLAGAAQGDAKDRAQIQLAHLYRRQHKYEQARAELLEVVNRNSQSIGALTSLSELAAIQGQYGRAIENLKKAREIKDSIRLISRHAELLAFAGEMDEAEKLVQQMRQEYPDAPVTNLVAGRMALFRLDYAASVAYADNVLAVKPDTVAAYLLKGEALYQQGALSEAMECLLDLRALAGPDSNAGRELLSVVYWQLSRYEAAIGELTAAAKINPRDRNVRERLVNMLKARSRWEQLEQFYHDMKELEPDSARWYVESGEVALARAIMEESNEQPRTAAGLYLKAINLTARGYKMAQSDGSEEEAKAALRSLVNALLESRQWKRVRKLIDEQLALRPDSVLLLSAQAQALYRLNDEAGALRSLDKAVAAIDAGSEDTLALLQRLDDIGDLKRLERWAGRKLGKRPDWPTMQLVLGMIYSAQGEFAKQVRLLEEALAGGLREDQQLPAQRALMVGYGRAGREDDAVALGRELSEKGVQDVGILNNLAYMLMEMGGHEEEAVELAGRAYSMAGTNVNIMDTYAMALMASGDWARAELMMRQAIREQKNQAQDVPAEFLYHQAQALVGLGRTLEARAILVDEKNRLAAGGADKKDMLMFESISDLLDELDSIRKGEAAAPEDAGTEQ